MPARLHPGVLVTVGPLPGHTHKERNDHKSNLPSKGYSEAFPAQLEGAIEPRLYGECIEEINAYIKTGDDGCISLVACLFLPVTACGSFCIMRYWEAKWEQGFVDLLKRVSQRDGAKGRVEFFVGKKTSDETGLKNYHPLQVIRIGSPAGSSDAAPADAPPPYAATAPTVQRTRSGKEVVAQAAAWASGVVVTGMPIAMPASPANQSMQRGAGNLAPAVVVQAEVVS